jgi:hypothetical protein
MPSVSASVCVSLPGMVLERRHKDEFKKILVAAGIPESEHEKEYSVNKETGEVTRIDSEIDPRLKAAFEKSDNK